MGRQTKRRRWRTSYAEFNIMHTAWNNYKKVDLPSSMQFSAFLPVPSEADKSFQYQNDKHAEYAERKRKEVR